jgi:hypothetical protein
MGEEKYKSNNGEHVKYNLEQYILIGSMKKKKKRMEHYKKKKKKEFNKASQANENTR